MSEVVQQTSATIHTFPPRGRFAMRRDGELLPTTESNQLRVANGIVTTGAWYHEQAIQDAARDDGAPKRQ